MCVKRKRNKCTSTKQHDLTQTDIWNSLNRMLRLLTKKHTRYLNGWLEANSTWTFRTVTIIDQCGARKHCRMYWRISAIDCCRTLASDAFQAFVHFPIWFLNSTQRIGAHIQLVALFQRTNVIEVSNGFAISFVAYVFVFISIQVKCGFGCVRRTQTVRVCAQPRLVNEAVDRTPEWEHHTHCNSMQFSERATQTEFNNMKKHTVAPVTLCISYDDVDKTQKTWPPLR